MSIETLMYVLKQPDGRGVEAKQGRLIIERGKNLSPGDLSRSQLG